MYETLLDKMSGKVWDLCRTLTEVCRTFRAYFAITALPCPFYLIGGHLGYYTTVNATLQNEMSICITLLKLDVWHYVLVYIGLQMNY